MRARFAKTPAAVAEDLDYGLIERLRLLLGEAGGPPRPDTLEGVGTTFAFRGRRGGEEGSAREVAGEEQVALLDSTAASDCRLAPIAGFEIEGSASRR